MVDGWYDRDVARADHRGEPRALAGDALLTRVVALRGGAEESEHRVAWCVVAPGRVRGGPGSRPARCSRARRSSRCRRSAACAPACWSASGSASATSRSRARRTAARTRHVERRRARCSPPAGWSRARSAAARSCRSTRAPRAACGRRGSATTARASTRSASPAACTRAGRSTATSAPGTRSRARCATASPRRAGSPAPSRGGDRRLRHAHVRGPAGGAGLCVRAAWRAAGSGPSGDRCAAAMRAHPELVAFDGAIDTELMRAEPGLVAKIGAEGVLAVGLADGRGLALKVRDGSRARRRARRRRAGALGAGPGRRGGGRPRRRADPELARSPRGRAARRTCRTDSSGTSAGPMLMGTCSVAPHSSRIPRTSASSSRARVWAPSRPLIVCVAEPALLRADAGSRATGRCSLRSAGVFGGGLDRAPRRPARPADRGVAGATRSSSAGARLGGGRWRESPPGRGRQHAARVRARAAAGVRRAAVPAARRGGGGGVRHGGVRRGRHREAPAWSHLAYATTLLGCMSGLCVWTAWWHGRQRAELARLSRTDPLTGCLNRRGLEDEVERAVADARPFTVVTLDLDDSQDRQRPRRPRRRRRGPVRHGTRPAAGRPAERRGRKAGRRRVRDPAARRDARDSPRASSNARCSRCRSRPRPRSASPRSRATARPARRCSARDAGVYTAKAHRRGQRYGAATAP